MLAIRDARALIGASASSQIGDWLYNAALLGYVFSATGSAWWVGAATVGRLLPYVVLSPVGGAIADRYPRRTVLLVGDLLRVALMVVLAVVIAADGPVTVVIVITALASAAGSAERPAALAMLPRLVGELRLGAANALLHTVQDLGVVIGPAIGALLLAVAPTWVAFLANAATFSLSALLIATMRHQDAPRRSSAGAIAHVTRGFQIVRATRFVLPLLVIVAMVELTYGAQTVQLVVYARQSLDLGEGGYGVLLAAAGAGGLLSAVINGRLVTNRRVSLVVFVAALLACATQLAYAGADGVGWAVAVALLGGAGLVACEVVAETALVGLVPADTLGRVMGVFDAVGVAAMVTGAVLAPPLLAATSLDGSLVALGAGTIVVAVIAFLGLRGLDAVRARRVDALASRLAVLERLPVTVGAPRLVVEQLASAAQQCPLPVGIDVVVEGAPAHAFYALVDGAVVVHRDGETIARIGPGGSFGERGLLDNAPRNATVTTETDATLLRIEGGALLDALGSAPMLRSALDRSNPGAPAEDSAMVDDPDWVSV